MATQKVTSSMDLRLHNQNMTVEDLALLYELHCGKGKGKISFKDSLTRFAKEYMTSEEISELGKFLRMKRPTKDRDKDQAKQGEGGLLPELTAIVENLEGTYNTIMS